MPHERDIAAMRDMLRCIEIMLDHVGTHRQETVEHEQELHDAVLFRFIVLGEAANRVSDEGREEHPEIPWVLAIKMRNFLIHVYDQVKWEIVWDTLKRDIPQLEAALRTALELPPAPGRSRSGDTPPPGPTGGT